MDTILMMPAKMTTLRLLRIKVLWNKGYDVITSVYGVTKQILPVESNYIVNVVMWRKIGNSSTSMREVIFTSIL